MLGILTAIHLASKALADGSASLALAGGAMLLLSAAVTSSFAQGGFLSPDGRCRALTKPPMATYVVKAPVSWCSSGWPMR